MTKTHKDSTKEAETHLKNGTIEKTSNADVTAEISRHLSEYHSWMEMITEMPVDVRPEHLNNWFVSAKAAGVPDAEITQKIREWVHMPALPQPVRDLMQGFLDAQESSFDRLTRQISTSSHPTALQLQEWWSEGLSRESPRVLAQTLYRWGQKNKWQRGVMDLVDGLVEQQKADPRKKDGPHRVTVMDVVNSGGRGVNLNAGMELTDPERGGRRRRQKSA